jgi:hypothetical protein
MGRRRRHRRQCDPRFAIVYATTNAGARNLHSFSSCRCRPYTVDPASAPTALGAWARRSTVTPSQGGMSDILVVMI